MPGFEIGSMVRVKAPFDAFFPGAWAITGINAETGAFQIGDGIDFDPSHLEAAE
jgi:hypothetical protein